MSKPTHEHLITPATLMTASRPLVFGPDIAQRLIRGDTTRNVTAEMMIMTATDAEGQPARLIDKYAPDSGYGSTEFGKSADPIADTAAFIEVAAAALLAPRVSKMGKVAVGIVLGTELVKGAWAAKASKQYKAETGETLAISPSKAGKRATVAKFAALTSAVATHDLEPGRGRHLAGVNAVAMAVTGTVLGEKARRGYAQDLKVNK